VVFFSSRLLLVSQIQHNTTQHVGVSYTRLLPPSSSSPIHHHPSLHPSSDVRQQSTIIRQPSTIMKTLIQEPRLKILNERLSTNTAGPSTLGKPFIKFTCKETWINNDLCVKVQSAGTSAKINRGKDSSKALRNTRPQRNICLKYRSKQNKTGKEQEFYPDVVVMGSTPPASSLQSNHDSGLASGCISVTTHPRPYCKFAGTSTDDHSFGG
jgi:hypothetical protein